MIFGSTIVLPTFAKDNDELVLPTCGEKYGSLLSTSTHQMPQIGQEHEVEIGQSMISAFNIRVMAGASTISYTFDKNFHFSGNYAWQDFDVNVSAMEPNIILVPGRRYQPKDFTFKYRNDSESRSGLSKPDLVLWIADESKHVMAELLFGIPKREFDTGVSASEVISSRCKTFGADSYRRELIYSGISQGTVTLSYREFLHDMARPAFTQELRYDLKEGNEIGFKGSRFKVLNANNLGIRFAVIKPLN